MGSRVDVDEAIIKLKMISMLEAHRHDEGLDRLYEHVDEAEHALSSDEDSDSAHVSMNAAPPPSRCRCRTALKGCLVALTPSSTSPPPPLPLHSSVPIPRAQLDCMPRTTSACARAEYESGFSLASKNPVSVSAKAISVTSVAPVEQDEEKASHS